jgi:hypothetical protein
MGALTYVLTNAMKPVMIEERPMPLSWSQVPM